jgi:hypothetical protein
MASSPLKILTSLHGRRFGLSKSGGLVLNKKNGRQSLVGESVVKRITSAQVLALFATPQTILAAQGAGVAIIPLRVAIYKPAGTAYAGVAVGEDLVLKYTNAAGAQCSSAIEATGFLDQATAQTRMAGMPGATGATAGDYAPVANAPVVLHLLTGEVITGNSDLYVEMWYDVIETAFTA